MQPVILCYGDHMGFKLLCCIYFNYYIFIAHVAYCLCPVRFLEIDSLSFFDVTLEVLWLPCSWVYQHVLRLNVFYCWVTNYHIFQVLKHLCLLSHTCVVPKKSITVWFSAQSLTRLKLKCRRSCIIGRSRKNLTSGLFSLSKDLISSGCRTELPFFCWPLTSGHSLLLETFRSFSHDPLSRFKTEISMTNLPCVFVGFWFVCLLSFSFIEVLLTNERYLNCTVWWLGIHMPCVLILWSLMQATENSVLPKVLMWLGQLTKMLSIIFGL